MSIFDTIENLSKRYWSHDHKRHRVMDESFEMAVESFARIEREVGGDEAETVRAALKDLWRAITTLQQCVARESDAIRDQARRIAERAQTMLIQYPEQFGHHLVSFQGQCDSIIRLCQNPNTGIYKGAKISTLLNELDRSNVRTLVVTRHKDSLDGLRKLCAEHGHHNVDVRTVDDLPEDGEYGSAVITSWTGAKPADKLIGAALTDKYHIVGYDHELAWAESYFNRVHAFPSKNLLGASAKLELYPTLGIPWPERAVPPVTTRAQNISDMAGRLNKVRKHGANQQVPIQSPVSARYCDLSGDYFAYLSRGYTANVVSVRGNTISVKEMAVDDLDEEYMLMFRGESEEGAVSSIVDTVHKDSRALREIVKIWHREITQRFSKASDLHRAVVGAGQKIALQTAQIWHGGWLRIAPEDKNLDVLAKVLGSQSETSTRLEEIKRASHLLNERHTSAGQMISQSLRSKIAEWRGDISETGATLRIPQLGQIDLVVIESISPNEELQDRSMVNRLLRQ